MYLFWVFTRTRHWDHYTRQTNSIYTFRFYPRFRPTFILPLYQGCTNPRCHFTQATTFCKMASNIWGVLVYICAPLFNTNIKHLTCLYHMQLEAYTVMLGYSQMCSLILLLKNSTCHSFRVFLTTPCVTSLLNRQTQSLATLCTTESTKRQVYMENVSRGSPTLLGWQATETSS
jgi:hypothetical protein